MSDLTKAIAASILGNLDEMRSEMMSVLNAKAAEALDAKKAEIGTGMFGGEMVSEKVEQIDELSRKTHQSYRAKARNEINGIVSKLSMGMTSSDANISKLEKRAKGVKKSYSHQKNQEKKNIGVV